MGLFSRLKSKPEPAKPVEEKEEKKIATSDARPATHVLLSSPRVSEKAAKLAGGGTYVFNVPLTATKAEIRKAVERHYKVNVMRVNTVRGEGKIVRRGRIAGRRADWKKALVTVKKGQTIDLYTGV